MYRYVIALLVGVAAFVIFEAADATPSGFYGRMPRYGGGVMGRPMFGGIYGGGYPGGMIGGEYPGGMYVGMYPGMGGGFMHRGGWDNDWNNGGWNNDGWNNNGWNYEWNS